MSDIEVIDIGPVLEVKDLGVGSPVGPPGKGLNIDGTASNAAALPSATDGQLWVTLDDGHVHLRESGSWTDLGPISGKVASVNHIAPDGTGDVTVAAVDVDARADTWNPAVADLADVSTVGVALGTAASKADGRAAIDATKVGTGSGDAMAGNTAIPAETTDLNDFSATAAANDNDVPLWDTGTSSYVPGPMSPPPPPPNVQDFTASGTWSKPAGAKTVTVEAISGGASGAVDSFVGAGGGGGGYETITVAAGLLGATETVTVAAGGAISTGSSANAGGASGFGTFTVPGATGGATSIAGGYGPGGTETAPGRYAGGNALASSGFGGGGGGGGNGTAHGLGGISGAPGTLLGGDGGDGSASADGTDGTAPGGGGGGKKGGGSSGAGARGQVRVTTYFQ